MVRLTLKTNWSRTNLQPRYMGSSWPPGAISMPRLINVRGDRGGIRAPASPGQVHQVVSWYRVVEDGIALVSGHL